MPIYEYRCNACGHYLDVLQRLADEPLTECPECQGSLRRLMSAPSFRLKGAGWYETDFKSDKERRRNLAEGSAERSESSSSDKVSSGNGSDKSSGDGSGKSSSDGATKASDKAADTLPKKESKDKGKGSAKSSGTEAA